MEENRIPYSWIGSRIGSRILLHGEPGATGPGLECVLQDVSSVGIAVSYAPAYVEGEGVQEEINFFPWASFHRLTKL